MKRHIPTTKERLAGVTERFAHDKAWRDEVSELRAYIEELETITAAPVPASEAASVSGYLVRSPNTGKARFMSKSKKHLIDHWQERGYEVTALGPLAAPAAPADAKADDTYCAIQARYAGLPAHGRCVTCGMGPCKQSVRDAAQPIAPGKDKP